MRGSPYQNSVGSASLSKGRRPGVQSGGWEKKGVARFLSFKGGGEILFFRKCFAHWVWKNFSCGAQFYTFGATGEIHGETLGGSKKGGGEKKAPGGAGENKPGAGERGDITGRGPLWGVVPQEGGKHTGDNKKEVGIKKGETRGV